MNQPTNEPTVNLSGIVVDARWNFTKGNPVNGKPRPVRALGTAILLSKGSRLPDGSGFSKGNRYELTINAKTDEEVVAKVDQLKGAIGDKGVYIFVPKVKRVTAYTRTVGDRTFENQRAHVAAKQVLVLKRKPKQEMKQAA